MSRFVHSSRQPRGELGSPPFNQSTDLKRRPPCGTIDRTILLVADDSAVRESLVRVILFMHVSSVPSLVLVRL